MRTIENLAAEKLRDLLDYDPETGYFSWRHSRGGYLAGSRAGYAAANGTHTIRVDRALYMAHRLAWLYVHGMWPAQLIDHIDGNPANNAIRNLREASHSENQRNNGGKGYYYNASRKKFQAGIRFGGRNIYLGIYDTAGEARAAYEAASLRYFGEFSGIISRNPASAGSQDAQNGAV